LGLTALVGRIRKEGLGTWFGSFLWGLILGIGRVVRRELFLVKNFQRREKGKRKVWGQVKTYITRIGTEFGSFGRGQKKGF